MTVGGDTKRIFKLTPLDPDDPNWKASTYCGEVVVRADDESDARWAATLSFAIATQLTPGRPVPTSPWRYGNLVRAEEIETGEWSTDGERAILSPKAQARNVPRSN